MDSGGRVREIWWFVYCCDELFWGSRFMFVCIVINSKTNQYPWLVTQWLLYVCINHSPRSIEGTTDENTRNKTLHKHHARFESTYIQFKFFWFFPSDDILDINGKSLCWHSDCLLRLEQSKHNLTENKHKLATVKQTVWKVQPKPYLAVSKRGSTTLGISTVCVILLPTYQHD